MKKTIFMMLTILLIISVSACSDPTGKGEAQSENKKTEDLKEKDTPDLKLDGEKKTIVFSTYFPDEFFEQAKKKYEAKHPNITIDLRYVESDDAHGEADSEKFIKTANTAMLSGKGPDLIEMDILPMGSYVNKQLLVNMSEMMEHDPSFLRDQYFTNILDAVTLNGGIYGMPMNFFLYGLVGNETVIDKSGVKIDDKNWNWSQFVDVAKELKNANSAKNQSALLSEPHYLLNEMVHDQYATFVDQAKGEASFDSQGFTALLQQVKSLFDEQVASETAPRSIFWNTSIVSPADYIRMMKQSEHYGKGYEFTSKLYAKPHADGKEAGGYFRTYKTIGMNAKSEVKAEAWDFIKFMLSDEVQAQAGSAGFPLNKNVYQKQVQQLLQEGKVISDQEMGPLKGMVFDVTAQDLQGLEHFLAEAIYPVEFRPSKIDEIITNESKAFFSGQKSAEAVAKLIQNRVTTFLNE
ncbi:ABC transporter substrate-binding protein [Paenibacillus selenitireducens]|uniref:ABC transporter substrate-binding protein n=1 Tax=Paenibacillus selenitireducens TaxID=1324314 RepID=A0A1T2WZK8_9BACL|nr:extracellular solute-binding protein [Paenibacillus selenitireducens]OPA73005.1 ABC transporter substrate-binding protein [Paenibacillus selenitireducens]